MANDVPADYAARIKSMRGRLGLTQTQLAELMGVSFASVNRWENGQSRPSRLAWRQLTRAEVLGIEGLRKDYALSGLKESRASYDLTETEAAMDFSADPKAVRVVAEGERLGYAHLFNPAFATETSLIDPLPHQRLAVYEHMLPQPRLRFLLADDAGAGKTIMAGLYIREMLSRRLLRRVLIVPPAGLVGNWEAELRTLFGLSCRIISGADAAGANPFTEPDADLAIVSVDTLAGKRLLGCLREPDVAPYDLVIFDEAHKLAANREPDFRVRKTDRYRLAEALSGCATDADWQLPWSSRHLLLLTATPHMGKDFPYYCLWRLLEPEVLPTYDAFLAYPPPERRRHFIRRTKEEMVRFDGSPIYPERISDTLSYDLHQGTVSEQTLYDETTRYIRTFYNRARILNRAAARFAMSIFQRRLASSTYALMRSFERRLGKLEGLIADIQSGRLSIDELNARQRRYESIAEAWEQRTADEEQSDAGQEESELDEQTLLGGVVAVSLAELEAERQQVASLLNLARQVYVTGHEAKFERLREIITDPRYRDEKLIIFTEHRDTLDFLVRRLEAMGYTGRLALIHGGMDYREREEQRQLFRLPADDGGATYLVATDAAGEGINLQFCWRMVNYDIPWNPARLEQRLGRIHRYGQKHDKVVLVNLVAKNTREGKVLKTLLEKLERIRKELGSDKVFDVVGRLFEGVSLRQYMEQALSDEGEAEAVRRIEGTLTPEQVQALAERERHLYGDGGEVRSQLGPLAEQAERDSLRRLLPGYVQRFIAKAAPLVGIGIAGDPDTVFSLMSLKPGALDPLWPALEAYSSHRRSRLTVRKPDNGEDFVFLHPGEPLFDRFRAYVCSRLAADARRGAVFLDPYASRPYLFHLALVSAVRLADSGLEQLAREETLEYRLVGLRQEEGQVEPCPVEQLLLLRDGQAPSPEAHDLAARAELLLEVASACALERVARPLAEGHSAALVESLPEREEFLGLGYDYQEAELAATRARLGEKVRAGDARARGELDLVKERQRRLADRRAQAILALRREPELIAPGEVAFLAHALVLPTEDARDRRRQDEEIEATAVRVAWAYEEAAGASVRDVSKPVLARGAGLTECPGFDLLSRRSDEERAVEVKGRVAVGDIELTENEWAQACTLRHRYWLYVVYDCASLNPRLLRVQDPFTKLLVRARGGVIVDEAQVFAAADG